MEINILVEYNEKDGWRAYSADPWIVKAFAEMIIHRFVSMDNWTRRLYKPFRYYFSLGNKGLKAILIENSRDGTIRINNIENTQLW
jgi:hypothetical protein